MLAPVLDVWSLPRHNGDTLGTNTSTGARVPRCPARVPRQALLYLTSCYFDTRISHLRFMNDGLGMDMGEGGEPFTAGRCGAP